MKKSVLVIGVGRFGRGVIETLYELGHDVYAIDKDENAIEDVRPMIVSGAIIDVVENEDELSRIVAEKSFDEAVVAMGQDLEATLIATHILKEAGIPVSAKASSERRGKILEKLGVERVLFPERDTGRRLAKLISNDRVVDIMELPQGFVVEQMPIGKGFHGKTIASLNTNNRFGIWIMLIYHNNEPILPAASTVLQMGDMMIVFGAKKNMPAFEKENFKG